MKKLKFNYEDYQKLTNEQKEEYKFNFMDESLNTLIKYSTGITIAISGISMINFNFIFANYSKLYNIPFSKLGHILGVFLGLLMVGLSLVVLIPVAVKIVKDYFKKKKFIERVKKNE